MENLNTYKSSYDFVPFPLREKYSSEGGKKYTGFLELKIICIKNVHIGNGYKDFFDKSPVLAHQTIKTDGKPIIPGSSLKGAVRNIAAAISSSCSPESNKSKDNKCKVSFNRNLKKYDIDLCITCDMFGAMSWGSKVSFSDFKAIDAKTKVERMNHQYGPHINADMSRDGYKFYQTGDNKYDSSSKTEAEVICAGSSFSGKIFFKNLTEEELCLLTYSLGLNKKQGHGINIKIGGFRNEGIGEIKTEVIEFKVKNNANANRSAYDFAAAYEKQKTADKNNITIIEDILWDGEE